MIINILPARGDNYMYLIHADGQAAVVDPCDASIVLRALDQHKLALSLILITHHHYDHTGGVAELLRCAGGEVVGPDDKRISEVHRRVEDGDTIVFGPAIFEVLETPGHTTTGSSYLMRAAGRPDALFCGDTLFVSGCGRALEGGLDSLWESLNKLSRLPEDTEVYCGHEYTEENLRFALSQFPGSESYRRRFEEIRQALRQGKFSVPSTIGTELQHNPFLRCRSFEEFRALRAKKDAFG